MTNNANTVLDIDAMMPPSVSRAQEHERLLIASGLVEGRRIMNVEHVVIDEDTFAEHQMISYYAHVLPYAVSRVDERRLLVRVDRKELEREGYTEKTLLDKLDEVLIPQVELQVVDIPDDF